MALLKIVQYPDLILKKPCLPVLEFDAALQTLLDDMVETLEADGGMGLAANQVAVSKRIFIMEETHKGNPLFFINPQLIFQSEERLTEDEGCLSFPGIRLAIDRPAQVTMKAFDREGKEWICEREGYSARCLLHEFDHLNGITFFDHLSRLKRTFAEKKLIKFRHSVM